jgi:PBP1b-binding outer membrane lipoprotein LpoB
MAKTWLAVILMLAVVTSGCATREQTAALDSQDDQACQLSGVSPGTQAYSDCRKRLNEQRASTRAQTQESKQRDIDAKMQLGIPPSSR